MDPSALPLCRGLVAGPASAPATIRPACGRDAAQGQRLPPCLWKKRYTWRVASALKWAFVDFENLNVVAYRRTLGQEDLDKLVDLLRHRPLQFCLFLSALFGEERMEKLMSASIQQVKTLRANRRKSLGREPGAMEE
jgi:hypothetical protein